MKDVVIMTVMIIVAVGLSVWLVLEAGRDDK